MLRFIIRLILLAVVAFALGIGWYRMAASAREDQSVEALQTETSRFVETAGGGIHMMSAGPEDGPPVLLIHGSVGWSGLWSETMKFLAEKGFRAIAIDLPPMGLSERTSQMDYSRQAQGLRILAFAETLDIRPIIVAHSFGAGAAFEAMMANPDRFAGAVIVAGALSLGQDGTDMALFTPLRSQRLREAIVSATITNPQLTRWLFQRFVHRKGSITDEIVGSLEYPFTRAGTTEALARWLPTLILPPSGAASSDPERYPTLGVPVALIWGREDAITPPGQAETLSSAMGNAPVFWLDDTGHIPQIETPEVFHGALENALAVVSAGG